MKSVFTWLYRHTASGIFCCPFGNLLASFKQLKLGSRKEFSSYLLLIDRNGVFTIFIDHRDLCHFLSTDLDLSGFIHTECDI